MNQKCGYCKNFPGDFDKCEFYDGMLFSDTLVKRCEYFIKILCI